MQAVFATWQVQGRIAECMDQRNERGIRTPHDLLREVQAMDSDDARRFVATMRSMRPRIVVNEVSSAEDVRLGFAVRNVCRTYFGLEAEYIGYLNRDDVVRRALREGRPVGEVAPQSDVAVYLRRIARKLADGIAPRSGAAGERR